MGQPVYRAAALHHWSARSDIFILRPFCMLSVHEGRAHPRALCSRGQPLGVRTDMRALVPEPTLMGKFANKLAGK